MNEIIIDAYERQLGWGLYYNILKADGDYDDEGHANSNAIEYFAHLSNKYLAARGRNGFWSDFGCSGVLALDRGA